LVLVVGLVLCVASVRDPDAQSDVFDRLQQVVLVGIVLDVLALAVIAARISECDFTPNRVATLGERLILLVNLMGATWLYSRFVQSRGTFLTLERWQLSYLPV